MNVFDDQLINYSMLQQQQLAQKNGNTRVGWVRWLWKIGTS
jgi:hypothetical protein